MVPAVLAAVALMNAAPVNNPCKGSDTISMAKCMDAKVAKAIHRLSEYTGRAEATAEEANDRSTQTAIADAALAFEAYRKIYCGAVYEQWRSGTIRIAISQSCDLKLIDDQTHRIWEDFLTPLQRPPILPEPKPTD